MKLGFMVLMSVSICCLAESDYQVISSLELYEQLHSGIPHKFFYLINVLPKSAYQDCSIPGSLNIPFHKLEQKLKRWPKQRKIVLYSANASCILAKHAYEKLHDLGFNNVELLEGGIVEWFKTGYPVVGSCKAGYLK